MATDSQTTANQINAQKCTGPTTPEGKATSSRNALKTGLYAKSDVIATESRDEYETLIAEYHARFHPATPEERCLVDDLIRSEWLNRRYMAATTAIWNFDFRACEKIRTWVSPSFDAPKPSPAPSAASPPASAALPTPSNSSKPSRPNAPDTPQSMAPHRNPRHTMPTNH